MKRMRRAALLIIGILSAGLLVVPAVEATIVPPGTTQSPDVFSTFGSPIPGATAAGTSSNTSYTLTWEADVYLGGLCGTCLTFVYQVRNEVRPGIPDAIGRITMGPLAGTFAGFLTDVGYAGPGFGGLDAFGPGTVAPISVDRSASGGTVGFQFAPTTPGGPGSAVGPGSTTRVLVIETNAIGYTTGSLNFIDGDVLRVTAFAPNAASGTAAVPEPTTLLLIGSGLVGLGLASRRIRRSR